MADIYEVLEIGDSSGNPTGRFRRTVRSDEDGIRDPLPLCDCLNGHATRDEANTCPHARQSDIDDIPRRKRGVRSTRGCGWQGFLGGAAYEDAGCAGGRVVDLDTCDEPGGPCAETGDQCPNCGGKGIVDADHKDVGPMALLRQRSQDELSDCLDELAALAGMDERVEYAAEIKAKHIKPLFRLIGKLESTR